MTISDDQALLQGRQAAEERDWLNAYELLVAADGSSSLNEEDLERLAFASYMIGRENDMVAFMERAHQLHLQADASLKAARAGFWIGLDFALRGEMGPASGWFGRVQRLVERHGDECAEAGYLLMPAIIQQQAMGDHAASIETAARAIVLGEQFDEPDLVALALHAQGRAYVSLGQVAEGLRLLDEAMVAVTADNLMPIVSGIIYCSVIEGCYEVRELRRAHAWTEALTEWCGSQPDLVAFTGQCLTHRAELMQLRGEWEQALSEAERAGHRFLAEMNQLPAAQAHYRQGELHRLSGDSERAEAAYRAASQWGWPPQPGLALLRLAQGNLGSAEASLRTALGETSEKIERARLLPALVEILLAAGQTGAADEASHELDEIAAVYSDTMIAAAALYTRGAVLLAVHQPEEALSALGKARKAWLELDAPYETARARTLIGQAYRELGDLDSATLELDAARLVFEQLGARPDLHRMASEPGAPSVLTSREIEVLRLVAAGKTNKAIAEELFVSDRTIDRHVSNIFTKLGVSSRTAAAAYAFEQKLV